MIEKKKRKMKPTSLAAAAATTQLGSFLTPQDLARASSCGRQFARWYADTSRFYVESDPGLDSGITIARYLRMRYGMVQWKHRNRETRAVRNQCVTQSPQELYGALAARLSFVWVGSRENFPWQKQGRGDGWNTLLNHARAEWNLTHKHELVKNLKTLHGGCDFHPESHVVKRTAKGGQAFEILPRLLVRMARHFTWIAKPGCGSCGTGVVIFDAAREFKQLAAESVAGGSTDAVLATASAEAAAELPRLTAAEVRTALRAFLAREYPDPLAEKEIVMQQYIDRPFLFNGRKFDVRCYLLIANVKPLVIFWHDGYIRVCTAPYEGAPLDNRRAHVTNFHVQREMGGYDAATDAVDGLPVREPWHSFLDSVATSPLLPQMYPDVAAGTADLEATVRTRIEHVVRQSVKGASAWKRFHPIFVMILHLLCVYSLLLIVIIRCGTEAAWAPRKWPWPVLPPRHRSPPRQVWEVLAHRVHKRTGLPHVAAVP